MSQQFIDTLEIEIRELLRREEVLQILLMEKSKLLSNLRLQRRQLNDLRLPPSFTYLEIEAV